MKPRQITGIVIHCSGTPNGQWINTQEIDQAHQARGLKREEMYRQTHNSTLHAIGCHFIIYPNGAIATGRHPDEPGQHTQTHNLKTIAICLVGADKFALSQWEALRDNTRLLTGKDYYPAARIVGCCEIESNQDNSPGFSVSDWLAGGMQPLPDHILESES